MKSFIPVIILIVGSVHANDALDVLDGVKGIATVRFTHVDVVRHELVTRIVQAYDGRPKKGTPR